MKILLTLLILFFFNNASGQDIAGDYYDFFGSTLQLKPDSTFKYTWRFDLASSWTKGKWRIENDTIYLKNIPVYDTLKYHSIEKGYKTDSLVLSMDESSGVVTPEEFVISSISGGGQARKEIPDKLYYRRGRLYLVDQNGDLVRKKQRGIMDNNKKYPPYYRKKGN
jgi:hypothetical protein